MGSPSKGRNNSYDYSFKILLIGDSGVGKSSLLLSFISNFVHDLSPTVGVDFKVKLLTIGGKRLKLTIWDTVLMQTLPSEYIYYMPIMKANLLVTTPDAPFLYGGMRKRSVPAAAGQERFGTVTSSYYRGAHGIILVYDVTRRETFTNLLDIWAKEVQLYSTNPECIKILLGNKVDRENERAVTREEGLALAQEHKCLFLECSAKTKENVHQCFKDLTLKILEVPNFLENGSAVVKKQILEQKQVDPTSRSGGCCS